MALVGPRQMGKTTLARQIGQLWDGQVTHFDLEEPSYVDILQDTYMVRALPPYLANTGKRQVKSPKLYIRDTGLLHTLLGVRNFEQLAGHPVLGSSWEGFAMDQVIQALGVGAQHCFFWGVHSGAELDLIVQDGGLLRGFEFKRTLSPKLTRSMRSAVETLQLSELDVIYPGTETFALTDSVYTKLLNSFIQE